jgi:hypothetical protein
MKTKTINCQQLAWEPSPSRKPGRKVAGRNEGFHLPNSVTEDVGGFSLMPYYSDKQLRRIGKKQRKGKNRGISRTAKNQRRMVSKW